MVIDPGSEISLHQSDWFPWLIRALTFRETHLAMEMIAQSGLMKAMDVVGLEPGDPDRVFRKTLEFILSAFGKKILGKIHHI